MKRAYRRGVSALAGPLVWMLRKAGRPGTIDRIGLRDGKSRAWEIEDGSGASHEPGQEVNDFPSWIVEVEDARLVGSDAIALDRNGDVLLDSLNHNRPRVDPALRRMVTDGGIRATVGQLARPRRARTEERFELACSLSSYLQANYYHWTIEQLPKLRQVEAYAERTGESPVLILPRRTRPFHEETLELAGHGSTAREQWRWDAVAVDRLLVPSGLGSLAGRSAWLRERVLPTAPKGDAEFPRRILISRQGTPKRRILNEDALAEALAPLGFEPLRLELLGVGEQALAFSRATAVVGAHGAGLTNLLYGSGRCSVIELFGSEVGRQYERLARATGAPYEAIQCAAVERHIEVDVDDARRRIERFLGP